MLTSLNVSGPVSLVLDLLITHERWGSRSDPSINGHLHYPNDVDRSLNDSFMSVIASTSGRLHSEFVFLLFLQVHWETDRFFAVSGVQLAQSDREQFDYRRAVFSSHHKSKFGNILDKVAALWIILNIDGAPVSSRSHTHPSHSQTSRLLTSSLSLGVPVPRGTQCV